jgi:hypothetical protein
VELNEHPKKADLTIARVVDAVHVTAEDVQVVELEELQALIETYAGQDVGLCQAHPESGVLGGRVGLVSLHVHSTIFRACNFVVQLLDAHKTPRIGCGHVKSRAEVNVGIEGPGLQARGGSGMARIALVLACLHLSCVL